jgi:MFS family permease
MQASTSSLAWVVDTFVLCFAGLLLPGGAVGDRFGRKGALQCGLVIFIVAATAGAFSTATWQLILARGVMGVGSALVMPGTLSILAMVFPPAERPRAIGIWASVAGGSVALSITWSGVMLENFWWGSIFLGMAAVAAAALVSGWWLLPTARHPEQARLDPLGAVLSVVGVTGLLYGFIQAPDDGWTAAPILAAFVVGAAALAAFVAWERHMANPMLDIRFFAERRFSLGSLAIVAAYLALLGMYFVFTQYLQLVRGYSPLAAGLYALPAGLAQFAVANVARPLVARSGIRPVLASASGSPCRPPPGPSCPRSRRTRPAWARPSTTSPASSAAPSASACSPASPCPSTAPASVPRWSATRPRPSRAPRRVSPRRWRWAAVRRARSASPPGTPTPPVSSWPWPPAPAAWPSRRPLCSWPCARSRPRR